MLRSTVSRTCSLALCLALAACGGSDDGHAGHDHATEHGSANGGGTSGGGTAGGTSGGTAGGSAHEGPAIPNPQDMERAAAQTEATLRNLNAGKDVKAVDPDKLRARLPETFAGLARSNAQAEHVSAMGIDTSKCSANYDVAEGAESAEDPPSYTIEITDLGNLKGAAAWSTYAWTTMKVDRRTETGWEKTTTVGGQSAYEEWDREGKYGKVQVLVAKRFMVVASGSNTTIEKLHSLAEAVDFAKLNALAE